jgi:ribosomal protein S26
MTEDNEVKCVSCGKAMQKDAAVYTQKYNQRGDYQLNKSYYSCYECWLKSLEAKP